jgi:hypothetical protein
MPAKNDKNLHMRILPPYLFYTKWQGQNQDDKHNKSGMIKNERLHEFCYFNFYTKQYSKNSVRLL